MILNIISTHPWGHKRLLAVKVLGKWRKANRIIGNRFMVQYAVDLDRMQLMASYGNFAYSSITKYIGFKVEDYAWMENH